MTSFILAAALLSVGAEPKAVIEAPPRVAPGNVVFLDGSKSSSDRPLKWVVVGKPASPLALITFDKDARKNVYALIPNAPEGTHTFALVAVGTTPDGKDLDAAIDVAQVTVGPLTPLPPAPAPDPTPGPTPNPAPTDPFGKMGYDYGKAIATTYAETFEESASMLAAGLPKSTVNSDFDKRWKKRRDAAFASVAAEFARIAPDDREANADERARLAQAWREFAKGLKSR